VRCYIYYGEKEKIYCSEGSYTMPARPSNKAGYRRGRAWGSKEGDVEVEHLG